MPSTAQPSSAFAHHAIHSTSLSTVTIQCAIHLQAFLHLHMAYNRPSSNSYVDCTGDPRASFRVSHLSSYLGLLLLPDKQPAHLKVMMGTHVCGIFITKRCGHVKLYSTIILLNDDNLGPNCCCNSRSICILLRLVK